MEIEAVARLQHPGVVMIYDHGIVDQSTCHKLVHHLGHDQLHLQRHVAKARCCL